MILLIFNIMYLKLSFDDMVATPCFTLGRDKDDKERTLLCTPSIGEKELWI